MRVSHPAATTWAGIFLGQFRFPGGPQILEQLGPWLQAGLADDPLQLGPQVGVRCPVRRMKYSALPPPRRRLVPARAAFRKHREPRDSFPSWCSVWAAHRGRRSPGVQSWINSLLRLIWATACSSYRVKSPAIHSRRQPVQSMVFASSSPSSSRTSNMEFRLVVRSNQSAVEEVRDR